MTLYLSLVFALLVFEIAKLQYAFKILFIILNRTYVLILDLLTAEEKLEEIKRQTATQSKDYRKSADNESQLKKEIEKLSKQLEEEKKKSHDFDILKKQAVQQSDEYMRLSERYNELEKVVGNHTNEDKKSV
ncbi:7624_t:CDS:2 [Ambispora gerdemannii]|uniref:7624_t:CDS:1 n=1 Tax=Ambispora gerdemannii TaxID=144530 RepID=A0A9N8V3T3_9GLOM|nr:7624_t:CDS:2 [Ambispora gerdemannii]